MADMLIVYHYQTQSKPFTWQQTLLGLVSNLPAKISGSRLKNPPATLGQAKQNSPV
jgi:hypothetical protein